jgi:hypothetical protein
MKYTSVGEELTYHARMKIKHVAQRFVPTVKPQMDHLRTSLRIFQWADVVVERLYVITALVTEVTSE